MNFLKLFKFFKFLNIIPVKMQKNRKQITIKRKWFKTKEGGDIEEFFKFSKTKDVLLVVFSVIIK